MFDLETVLATGRIIRFEDFVAWGEFDENELGLATFDIPVSPDHHEVDDQIKWYNAEDANADVPVFGIFVFGKEYLSIYQVTSTLDGFEIIDGILLNRELEVIGSYGCNE